MPRETRFRNEKIYCPNDGGGIQVVACAARREPQAMRFIWCWSCKVMWTEQWSNERGWENVAELRWESQRDAWKTRTRKEWEADESLPCRIREVVRHIPDPENFEFRPPQQIEEKPKWKFW